MPDESALAKGAMWALIKMTVFPMDSNLGTRESEVGLEVCPAPDSGDAVGSLAIELHGESGRAESLGARTCSGSRPTLGQGSWTAAPKDIYYSEMVFRSKGALTHVKSRCTTMNGEKFLKAARLPEPLDFIPGDRARIEVQVFRDFRTPRIGQAPVEFFEEQKPAPEPATAPELGRRAPRLAQADSGTSPAFKVVVFETAEEQAQGLQDRSFIEPNTIFVFPYIRPGAVFHSRNVREPFDLAFLSFDNVVLEKRTIHPTQEVAVAPEGTWTAIEARAGWLDYWKFVPGYRVELPYRG